MSSDASVTAGAMAIPQAPAEDRRELAIEVRDLKKGFRIPTQRVDTLKERVTSMFARREYRTLEALRGIDFDVRRGEFFGIVGRNGSGKSTLLKLLASIYRADTGRIRIAGRIAPCIELGVGFNPDLEAYENVVLNGVMMGLTPSEARARFDAVIEFAELEDYTDLKLKNYSSGMLVRLGFSLMTQVDADVLLIDEVLAVGDASFQQKCFDVFARVHSEGRTIVLVTHDMASIEAHCDRAILLEAGRLDCAGDPAEVARRYLDLNFPDHRRGVDPEDVHGTALGEQVRIVEVRLREESDVVSNSFAQGEPVHIEVELEAAARLEAVLLSIQLVNADGLLIFAPKPLSVRDGRPLEAGDRLLVRARIDNPLAAGHYFIHCGVGTGHKEYRPVAFRKNAADFVVFGTRPFAGLVGLGFEAETIEVSRDRPAGP